LESLKKFSVYICRYGQPPVDTEHDKPSSLTHIDAEPLLKKLCQDEREDAREPAHRSRVLHREALKLAPLQLSSSGNLKKPERKADEELIGLFLCKSFPSEAHTQHLAFVKL